MFDTHQGYFYVYLKPSKLNFIYIPRIISKIKKIDCINEIFEVDKKRAYPGNIIHPDIIAWTFHGVIEEKVKEIAKIISGMNRVDKVRVRY